MTDKPTPDPKDLIELPGPFTFKIFVKPDEVTDAQILELASHVLGRQQEPSTLSKNTSRTGKYEAYTLTAQIEVFEEIESLYSALRKQPGVVMTL